MSFCFGNIGVTILFASFSRLNYPGGEIGQALVDLAIEKKQMTTGHPLSMHKAWLSASALHSGVALFTLPEDEDLVELGLKIFRPQLAYVYISIWEFPQRAMGRRLYVGGQ